MLTYDHTRELFESLGIDSAKVLTTGWNETGYLVFGRDPNGRPLPATSEASQISRVPWPTPDAFRRFQEAQLADGVLPPDPLAMVAARSVEAAADWLEARRDATWNGGERRPSNFGRAATELRQYAADLRNGNGGAS
ncbi:hypothetical protein [uncultured Microbacterium sp.]|uniref:hypothetical protein n=1 Tax=uncultured Microbacterium sp. TaxID=191216 RepID=UPI0025E0A026|nr:hypothetical protein [uncultured Microbacterium sp.]